MKYCIHFFLFFVVANKTNAQTCIVLVRTPTQIFIGADTKTTKPVSYLGENNEQKFRLDSFSTCKIFKEGNVFFCFAGSSNSELNTAARTSILLKKSLKEIALDFFAPVGVPKKSNTPLLCVVRWPCSRAKHQQREL